MQRLFFRFYLFIVVCLITLGWAVETLWHQTHQNEAKATVSQTQLALVDSIKSQILNSSSPTHLHLQVEKLSQKLQIPLKLIIAQQIALPPTSMKNLEQGQHLVLFDQNENPIIYQQLNLPGHNNFLLVVGPLQEDNFKATATPLSVYLLFYLFLGLLIALWLWPLWSDLKKVQRQCDQVGRKKQDAHGIDINKSSSIYPIAQTIEQMDNRITTLLNTQKQMSSAVSHELRTPLARTKFALAMVPENCVTHANAISEDIDEMENIIEQLLDFARIEADGPKLNLESVDLILLLQHQVQKLQGISEKQLAFTPKNAELLYQCDGFYLERILSNLLSNANRYAQSTVEVSILKTDQQILINIDDDGPGIPADELASIFNPFYRLDKSRGKATGGVGLGLSIVQRLVQWHDGHCKAELSPLGGARFILKLPIKKH